MKSGKLNVKHIIALIGAALLLIILWQFYLSLTFRVISIVPNPSKIVATSTDKFEIKFNKKLAKIADYSKLISSSNIVIKNVSSSNDTLIINVGTIREFKEYKITIQNIVSESNQQINEINIKFNARYKSFNELTEEEQRIHLDSTDINAIEDPIDQYLPHNELEYELSGMFIKSGNNSEYVLFAKILLSKSDLGNNRDPAIARQKARILDYIKSKNIDPDKYKIEYTIVDPPF